MLFNFIANHKLLSHQLTFKSWCAKNWRQKYKTNKVKESIFLMLIEGLQKFFKYLPTCISRSEFGKSRASVVELAGAELIWCIFLLKITCRKGPRIMQIFGLKKVKLFHHITSVPSNTTTEVILIPHFKETHFLKMVAFYIT